MRTAETGCHPIRESTPRGRGRQAQPSRIATSRKFEERSSRPTQTQAALGRVSFDLEIPSYMGMSRRLRYIPEGGSLVEVTCRTLHSRFLLRPGPELNDLVVGDLGRAQRLYEVR